MALRASSPSSRQARTAILRLAVVAAYAAVFWGVLPAALVWVGFAIDRALGSDASPNSLGLVAVVPGLALLIWAMIELRWRGRGLPVSALPPARLVVSGPYRFVRHPIYLGWNLDPRVDSLRPSRGARSDPPIR
jgi:protein-S-isoprenylcysteine O-methyltransferase Ste14